MPIGKGPEGLERAVTLAGVLGSGAFIAGIAVVVYGFATQSPVWVAGVLSCVVGAACLLFAAIGVMYGPYEKSGKVVAALFIPLIALALFVCTSLLLWVVLGYFQ